MSAIPQDKCLHVIAGMIIFALSQLLYRAGLHDLTIVVSFALVALVGALKELADHFDGGDCSIYDWLATCVGGLIGVAACSGAPFV